MYNWAMDYQGLISELVQEKVLTDPKVIQAFLANDRQAFVPEDFVSEAYVDAPLAIGAEQTISQPWTVAFMIELLDPRPGQKILDVGFGSGWTTAILASLVGEQGKVYGLEIVPEVFELGQNNLRKFSYKNIELLLQSGWEGLPTKAPFDRILVSAVAPKVPEKLLEQLAIRGRMVIPVGESFSSTVKLIGKISPDKFSEEDYPGFAFVPLVQN